MGERTSRRGGHSGVLGATHPPTDGFESGGWGRSMNVDDLWKVEKARKGIL